MKAESRQAPQYLIPDYPLIVLPKLAVAIGLNEAIALQQAHYLLGKLQGKTIDGIHWIKMTDQDWGEQFPFWSRSTIRNVIGHLVTDYRVLQTSDHLSDDPMDHSTWYTIEYAALNKLPKKKTRKKRSDYPNFGQWAKDKKTGAKQPRPESPNFGQSNGDSQQNGKPPEARLSKVSTIDDPKFGQHSDTSYSDTSYSETTDPATPAASSANRSSDRIGIETPDESNAERGRSCKGISDLEDSTPGKLRLPENQRPVLGDPGPRVGQLPPGGRDLQKAQIAGVASSEPEVPNGTQANLDPLKENTPAQPLKPVTEPIQDESIQVPAQPIVKGKLYLHLGGNHYEGPYGHESNRKKAGGFFVQGEMLPADAVIVAPPDVAATKTTALPPSPGRVLLQAAAKKEAKPASPPDALFKWVCAYLEVNPDVAWVSAKNVAFVLQGYIVREEKARLRIDTKHPLPQADRDRLATELPGFLPWYKVQCGPDCNKPTQPQTFEKWIGKWFFAGKPKTAQGVDPIQVIEVYSDVSGAWTERAVHQSELVNYPGWRKPAWQS